jgi:lipoate-protein ligase A
MDRNAGALKPELGSPKCEVRVQGHTDLTLNGVKFSGNAQRRKRRCLLFHGTILLGLDLALVETLLPMPSLQPEYRQNRTHREFVRNLPLDTDAVKRALCAAWQAKESLGQLPVSAMEELVVQKYSRREWTFR